MGQRVFVDKAIGSGCQSLATHLRSFASNTLALFRDVLLGDVRGGGMGGCWRRRSIRCIDLEQLPGSSLVAATGCSAKCTLEVVQRYDDTKSENSGKADRELVHTSLLLLP